MFKEGGNFLLDHIEKIVLVIVGLVCMFILVTRVLLSPNYVSYEGKKLTPDEIDNYIKKEAARLNEKFEEPPAPKEPYRQQLDDFLAKFNSSIEEAYMLRIPVPEEASEKGIDRKYGVPVIGQVHQAQAELIRAVAYVPKSEIKIGNPYSSNNTEPNDIDLITVEAKLDVSAIYESFSTIYNGPAVQTEWQDPCLAVPVFAAVELQRQKRTADGQWSEWKRVPRAKIDDMRTMLEIIEDVNGLPRGGMKVRLLQFNKYEVMRNILQPQAYNIASAYETWFPPELHKKFLKIQAEEKAAERRDAMAKEKEAREREAESNRSSRDDQRRTTTPAPGANPTGTPSGIYQGTTGTRDRTQRTPERTERSRRDTRREREETQPARTREETEKETIESVYEELSAIQINEEMNFSNMEDEVLIWAHDDTAEPGSTYRYRIRVGVFNPLAGSDSFLENSTQFKNQAILWSDFSETAAVDVPARLYFFATDILEAVNTVKVEVAKYEMGYWYSDDFLVKQGEVIGGPKEQTVSDEEKEKKIIIPSQINYTTGAVMVDTVSVDDWEGSKVLKPRRYFEMYYSYDGLLMGNIPVRQKYWPSDLQNRYNEIRSLLRLPKEPLAQWGTRIKGYQRSTTPTTPGTTERPTTPGDFEVPPGIFQ